MKYHNILHNNMLNGAGLRVVLFVSGCERHCKGCQNKETWNKDSGITFGTEEVAEIFGELEEEYCSGLTLVGGEPLMPYNRDTLTDLCKAVKEMFPNKTIWCYTGFLYDEVKDLPIMEYIDVLLDGAFIEELADVRIPWVGSSNQRVIDIKATRQANDIVLYKE
jgi:anaerobic ribonucleoside-triphosphate reductase activating protein